MLQTVNHNCVPIGVLEEFSKKFSSIIYVGTYKGNPTYSVRDRHTLAGDNPRIGFPKFLVINLKNPRVHSIKRGIQKEIDKE